MQKVKASVPVESLPVEIQRVKIDRKDTYTTIRKDSTVIVGEPPLRSSPPALAAETRRRK